MYQDHKMERGSIDHSRIENVGRPSGLLVRIALFLNLIAKTLGGSEEGQETQVLSFGSELWIANNSDEDTVVQLKFLETHAVFTPATLAKFVDYSQVKVLSKGNFGVVPSSFTPKQKLLFALMEQDGFVKKDDKDIEIILPDKPSKDSPKFQHELFKLNSEANLYRRVHLGQRIVFVVGDYKQVGDCAKFHAEQKLVAAALHHKIYFNGNTIKVMGCKTACKTCDEALCKAANGPLRHLHFRSDIDDIRPKFGLGTDSPPGIALLDTDAY